MLTRQLAIAELDFRNRRIVPDRLTQRTHAHYVRYAERMLGVYRQGVGEPREELHRRVRRIFADDPSCPVRRIQAFCKLLDDAASYRRDLPGKAAALRNRVFRMAARYHPLVERPDRLFDSQQAEVKQQIAAQLGLSWEEIDAALFADVIEFHRMQQPPDFTEPRQLLARYNVAQCQTALFDAVELQVLVQDDFKTVLRYAKLAGLLHTIERRGPGRYQIRFDGPASVVRHTRRYGVAMAKFLPALLACRGWSMRAVICPHRSRWRLALDLSPRDGLTSHLPPPADFDSSVEENLYLKWGPDPREGWRLERESEILFRGQKAFVPDFTLRHESGLAVPLEIVGFWTPEYLRAKLDTLRQFQDRPLLLAVASGSGEELDLPALPEYVLRYKTVVKVSELLQRLTEVTGIRTGSDPPR